MRRLLLFVAAVLYVLAVLFAFPNYAIAWDESCPEMQPGTDCRVPVTTQPTTTTTVAVAPPVQFTG